MKLKIKYVLGILFLLASSGLLAQNETADIRNRLSNYFDRYTNRSYMSQDRMRIENIVLQPDSQALTIQMNEAFQGQPFTPGLVDSIYHDVRLLLPQPYNTWRLTITSCGNTLEQFIPINLQQQADTTRTWGNTNYHGYPWTRNLDRPYKITAGLEGRHLMIWASHGRYYALDKKSWLWQRPNIFNTCEDMFTQTFVVPFIIPMLENAGAVVFTPRERDWQTHEIIVDNDDNSNQRKASYNEYVGLNPWNSISTGFAKLRDIYLDKQNPFEEGTSRQCQAQSAKRGTSTITWTPDVPEDGNYAVYVSYKTLPNSVPDATYRIRHGSTTTRIRVNQQMGGGTWVYLGTYFFKKGQSPNGSIQLTNRSNYRGVVTADAVRLGGGMGNIARGDSINAAPSGLPRYLEGARYYMQWAGMPYSVYGTKQSQNDYGEDINSRSVGVNHLTRGSVHCPTDTLPGLRVPIELSLAVHSDAGLRKGNDLIGTLGIYTSQYNDGKLATGLSRLASRDFAELMLGQVTNDMQRSFGHWQRRQIYDRNYSETREPQVPSIILEMFSHQNFADMLYGHDPYCKFIFSRAVYKAVLRYVSYMHSNPQSASTTPQPVVQPLPVHALSAESNASNQTITISWHPTADSLEATAKPTSYILYSAHNRDSWDNGFLVEDSTVTIPAHPGILYRFRITAVNAGGQSMPSPELCARCPLDPSTGRILIVNAFNRLAAPQAIDTDSLRTFDIRQDPGVGYMSNPSVFSLSGENIAGNTFNYPTLHAEDFLMTDSLGRSMIDISISSCTADVLDTLKMNRYPVADIIFGAQRNDHYSHRNYTCYTPQLRKALTRYHNNGGNLVISGAYVGEDIQDAEQQNFAESILKYKYNSSETTDTLKIIEGKNSFTLQSEPNRQIYSTARVNALQCVGSAFATLHYADGKPAAVAHKCKFGSTIVYGFPLELVTDKRVRRKIFNTTYNFLLP